MIRVIHLITDLCLVGGAEMMLYKLLSYIDRSRFYNVVVSLTSESDLGNQIKALGIPVYYLDMAPGGQPGPGGIWRLWRILRRERPDILQTWLYLADMMGLMAGKLAGVPVILWNLRCSGINHSTRSAMGLGILAKLSGFPRGVVVNSAAGKRLHESLGYRPRRWKLIPNGFDLDRFSPDPLARSALRKELELPEDAMLVGLVARYDPLKDHATFLKAAGCLLKDYGMQNVSFVLVGRGINRYNNDLIKCINSLSLDRNVFLLDERKDIEIVTSAFDVAVSSSYSEGFSNTIGEAMACGVPCVVTDVGDSANIVGDSGIAVPPQDHRALAEAWAKVLSLNDNERKALGQAARHRIASMFSIQSIVKQYEELYCELGESK